MEVHGSFPCFNCEKGGRIAIVNVSPVPNASYCICPVLGMGLLGAVNVCRTVDPVASP